MDSKHQTRPNVTIDDKDPQTEYESYAEHREVSNDEPMGHTAHDQSSGEERYISLSELEEHPPQYRSSQYDEDENLASRAPVTRQEGVALRQESKGRPTEDLQPHRRPSLNVFARRHTDHSALRREVATPEGIGRPSEEGSPEKSKVSIWGRNHRNRFWFAVLLAWVAGASAVYNIFAEEWTNFGGSVTGSFSCDVVNVDFMSYLENIPGWDYFVDLEILSLDLSYLSEDVETVGEFFTATQAEINAVDERFCDAVATVAVMQIVATALFLVAACILIWASISPALGKKYASSVALGRAGGIIVILGMTMQIAVCVAVAYMVFRINSKLNTYLGNMSLYLDLLDEYILDNLSIIPFFSDGFVDTIRAVIDLLVTKFDTGATFIYGIMTAGLGFLAALGLCLNAASAGDGILRCCGRRTRPAPVETSPAPTSG